MNSPECVHCSFFLSVISNISIWSSNIDSLFSFCILLKPNQFIVLLFFQYALRHCGECTGLEQLCTCRGGGPVLLISKTRQTRNKVSEKTKSHVSTGREFGFARNEMQCAFLPRQAVGMIWTKLGNVRCLKQWTGYWWYRCRWRR